MTPIIGFITGPSVSAQIIVPSRTPTRPWKNISDRTTATATIAMSKISSHLGTGHPVFCDMAAVTPSAGAGEICGVTYTAMPSDIIGMLTIR